MKKLPAISIKDNLEIDLLHEVRPEYGPMFGPEHPGAHKNKKLKAE